MNSTGLWVIKQRNNNKNNNNKCEFIQLPYCYILSIILDTKYPFYRL